MAIPSKAVKSTAKSALKGRWLVACCACLTLLLSSLLVSFVCTLLGAIVPSFIVLIIFYLLTVFLICPLVLGLLRFFKNLIFEKVTNISEVFIYFSGFKAYKRALRLILDLFVRLVFYAAICFIPAGIVKFITTDFFFNILNIDIPIWSESLDTLLSFLIGMAALTILAIMLRYYLAPFLVVANDDMAVDEAIHMATIIARRSSGELWALLFSFTGYFVLSLFVIPLIFTLPYFLCSLVVHSRFSVTGFNLSLNQSNAHDF